MTEDAKPRRRFLQALAIVPASTLAVGGLTTACTSGDDGKTAQAAKPYAPTYFTQPEWTFIVAAVDHLIPADDYGPGAIAAGVPEFIDRQMETPFGHGKLWYMDGPFHTDQVPELGYQLNQNPRQVYRHGIEACNAWCVKTHGKVYAELDKALQEQILKDLQGGKIRFDTVPATTFFSFLLSNTKEGFLLPP